VYSIPVACYHERIQSLCIGTVLKSKERYTIISGRIPALVEVAEVEHRADRWLHLARLQTEHDTLWFAITWALGNDDADVIVRLAQGSTKPVARLLGTAAAWLDACGTIIDQTERADHDDSIVATHATSATRSLRQHRPGGRPSNAAGADSCPTRRCSCVICAPDSAPGSATDADIDL
jgi:hypothetical protein